MKLTKSKARVKAHGEVFTPKALVDEMLSKLSEDCWQPEKTFLEPACGHGNFLEEIIRLKIKHGSTPLQALQTTYGIDIQADNVIESRKRMLQTVVELGLNRDDLNDAIQVLKRNIILGNALTMDFDEVWKDE
jgi:type I restriction-modification system DNA methylase subunit